MPRRLNRNVGHGTQSLRRVIHIAAEGTKTEPEYFRRLNQLQDVARFIMVKKQTSGSTPIGVLNAMKKYVQSKEIGSLDEVWLVVDRDSWPEENLNQLYQWTQAAEQRGLALSNPNFEYWLLLHFEDTVSSLTGPGCTERLKKHLPKYDKGLPRGKIGLSQIQDAIKRARQQDEPPCQDWPRHTGTTVYLIVQKVIL